MKIGMFAIRHPSREAYYYHKNQWGHPLAFEVKGRIPMLFSTIGQARGFIARNCLYGVVVAVNVTIEEEQNA